MNLKICLIFALAIVGIAYSNPVHHEMLKLISTRPVNEQFKLWHYIMQRPYDLNSQEAVEKFVNFKKNVKRINEINSRNLGYTVGIGMFSDFNFDDNKTFSPNNYETIDTPKFDFDVMADLYDSEENEDTNTVASSEKDWSSLFVNSYPKIEINGFGSNIQNYSIQHSIAHTINGNAKIEEQFNGNASAQHFRNCIRDGTEDPQVVYAVNYYSRIKQTSLEVDEPWLNQVKKCEAEPKKSNYSFSWNLCAQFHTKKCSENQIKNIIETGPYTSLIEGSFEVLHYTGGIFPATNCTSASFGVIVVQVTEKFIKALFTLGPNFGENGYIRVANETVGHPIISCGLKSYALLPIDIEFNKK